jgi:hypothetical protein
MHRTPEQFPDPWLFDSEALLRELAKCREAILLIPAMTQEAHFAAQAAIDRNWNLERTLRYLLHLHREGQRAFAQKSAKAIAAASDAATTTTKTKMRRRR